MNEQELEIAKKIAEIEGVQVNKEFTTNCKTGKTVQCLSYLPINTNFIEEMYNPFNWSILGSLMVKYKVEILYAEEYVAILDGYGEDLFWEYFEDENDIPRAILKCIITSQDDLTGDIL